MGYMVQALNLCEGKGKTKNHLEKEISYSDLVTERL